VLTGLLAGGMVLIEVVLLPFWRGSSPADFRDWFAAHSGRIRDLMIPLGAGAGTVGAASAVAHWWKAGGVPLRRWLPRWPRPASSASRSR
jgi:hypothetical protein